VIFFTFEGLPCCHYPPQLRGESHAHNKAFGGCRGPVCIRGFWHLRAGTFGQVSWAADRPSLWAVGPRAWSPLGRPLLLDRFDVLARRAVCSGHGRRRPQSGNWVVDTSADVRKEKPCRPIRR